MEFGVLALHMRVTLGLARRAVDRSRPAAVLAARPSRRHDFSYGRARALHSALSHGLAAPPPDSCACGLLTLPALYGFASPRHPTRWLSTSPRPV